MKSLKPRRLRSSPSQKSLRTRVTILMPLTYPARTQIRKLFSRRFTSSRSASITKKRPFLRKSSSSKKLATWLKSFERKPSTVERQHWKLQRKSTSTKLARLSFHERCLPQSLSFPCSNRRPSSSNKRKRRRMQFSNRVFKTLSNDCLLLKILRWNGNACSATPCVDAKRPKSAASAKPSRPSSLPRVSRLRPCPVPTVTCHPTSKSRVHTACSPHISLASLAHKCGISSSHSPKRSNTELLKYLNTQSFYI